MFKLAIIDDEHIVVQGILSILDMEKYHLELSGVSEDGVSGLQLIREHRPDIVITDIRMPGMSGLDMIEQVKDAAADTVFIMMSGFNDFKYVQRAIGLGVIDYLEKPITVEKVLKALEKAIGIVEYRRNYHCLNEKLKDSDRLKIKNALHSIFLKERKSREELEALLQESGGGLLDAKEICIAVLEQQEDIAGTVEEYRQLINRISLETARYKNREVIALQEECHIIFIFFNIQDEEGSFAGELKERIKELEGERIFYCLGISRIHRSLYEMREAYEEARSALRYALFFETDSVLCIDDVEYTNHIPEDISSGQESIVYHIRMGDDDKTMELVDAYIVYLQKLQLSPELFCHECLELIYLVLKLSSETGRSYASEHHFYPHNEIRQYGAGGELKAWLHRMISEILKWKKEVRLSSGNRNIQIVKEYIRMNYAKSITLEELAEVVNMNQTYLSVLFKQEAGTTYVKYLTSIRMEQAMKLLKNGEKAKDICAKVGYFDYKHFSTVFKKYTGMSPIAYRSV